MEEMSMNDFENKIKGVLKKEVEKPLSYDYAIKNGYGLGMIEILEWYQRYHDGIGQQLLQYRINRILYGELDYL